LALIQEGLEQSKRDFDSFLEENIQIEWDAQRKRIYEHFGLGRQSEEMAASQSAGGFGASTARGAFGRSTRKGRSMGPKAASTNGASFGASGAAPVLGSVMSPYQKRALNGQDSAEKSAIGGQSGPEDRFVRDKQEKFMDKVKELNVTRLQQAPYPVLHAFGEVEQQSGSDYAERFAETYNALISLTGEVQDPHAAAGSNIPRARCFVRDYHDLNVTAPNSIRLRKRIINGSRTHLEKQFLQSVQKTISKHPGEANAGGVPTNLAKIRGYIRVKIAHKELTSDIEQLQKIGTDGDEFPWVIIFFLLRSGLTQEASEYVRERRNFFQNNDRNFASAIAQYVQDPERRLSPDMQQKINHVFAQRARIAPTNDPYRMACYKIIGRCEMTRRTLDALPPTMEDWVWLQFNLAREGNPAEENAGEIFGLQELRASVSDIGQRHFATNAEAAGGYGLYFYLATLAGMFEQAINYLYEHNYVSAVHFAIALDYYGLLRVSDWASSGTQIRT
jgi:nuclear pore complex protein Nup93